MVSMFRNAAGFSISSLRGSWAARYAWVLGGCFALALLAAPSSAATLTWGVSGTGGGGAWRSNNAWNGATWTSSPNDAVFGGTGGSVSLMGGANTGSLTFNAFNGTYTFQLDNNSTSRLSIGTGGITMNSGAGAVTIRGGGSTIMNSVLLGSSQSWTNNSSSLLTIASTVNISNGSITVAGSGNASFNGIVQSSGGLTKSGNGLLTLGAANTYTGNTIISGGTLALGSAGLFANSGRIVVGDAGSSGAVLDLTAKTNLTIGSAQTLMGKGAALLGPSTALTVAGTFSPGNSPGLFTLDGGSTTLTGSTVMEIFGTSRGVVGGYDAVDIVNNGLMSLGGALVLDFNQTFATNDTFLLFQGLSGGSLAGTFGSYSIIGSSDYTGLAFSQVGTSNVWRTGQTGAGQSLELTYGSNALTLAVVPEPGTLAMAGAGLAFIGWKTWRRRNRRKS
jgi:fibronectin-binding autotransporter adhesin